MSRDNRFDPFISKSFKTSSMAQRPPGRILASAGKRLSTIMENTITPTTSQVPSSNSSTAKKLLIPKGILRKPTGRQSSALEQSPATDTTDSSLEFEKQRRLTENKHIARRGGWLRLALILLLLLLILLGLGLGLGLGLTRKHRNSTSTLSSSPSPSAATASAALPTTTGALPGSNDFPLGTYSLLTYLTTTTTNCTSNPSTWTCFPYTTFSSSSNNPSGALATFNWAITTTSLGHAITSLQDPLAITIPSQPLHLVDAGQPSERYAFNVTLPKQVTPSAALTPDGAASTCWYNGTSLRAELYTRMAGNNTAGGSGVGGDGASYTPWPFAVRVEQVAAGGEDVPDCYEVRDGVVGARITTGLEAESAGEECSCVYQNFDLS